MPLTGDHVTRLDRALISLQGLSVGDAFGESFFGPPDDVLSRIAARQIRPPVWSWTDDTAMALSIVDQLARHRAIDQTALARHFANQIQRDPMRGYGAGARQLLQSVAAGTPWHVASSGAFHGQGSLGNGAAMRVGPLGAYFADDLDQLVTNAAASAQVTHYHSEGQAGAVAIALAAAYACRVAEHETLSTANALLDFVLDRTPPGETRLGIRKAIEMGRDAGLQQAVAVLGVGERVSAADTVPFALWCANRHLTDYESALWTTVAGLGDRDTTCAMVGSIVILCTGPKTLPTAWLKACEPYPDWFRSAHCSQ